MPTLTQQDLVEALFADGISSRDEVNERSGRGVGLAAARQATLALHGSIEVESEHGSGAILRMSFPLDSVWLAQQPAHRPSFPLGSPAK